MTETLDKSAIARSFGRAAHSYDQAAHFQRWVADRLLAQSDLSASPTVLDLGCGTGYCMQHLPSHITRIGVDLSESMLSVARTKVKDESCLWLSGDAEQLPLQNESVSAVISSLAIQWCADTDALFREIHRILRPGGVFLFSTLLEGTLCELKDAWAEADHAQHVNRFGSHDSYEIAAKTAGFCEVSLHPVTHVLRYQRVRELLSELKAIGAHNVTSERARHVTPKSTYRKFEAAYESRRDRDGLLPATYQVLFGLVRKEEKSKA
jgi:malonyl-CoA O-methyltransferase